MLGEDAISLPVRLCLRRTVRATSVKTKGAGVVDSDEAVKWLERAPMRVVLPVHWAPTM